VKANPGEALTVERQKCPPTGGELSCLPWFTPRRAARQSRFTAKASRIDGASAIGGENHSMGESRQPVTAKVANRLKRGDAGQIRKAGAAAGNSGSDCLSVMSGNESEDRQRR